MLENIIIDNFDVSFLRASVPESEGQHLQKVYSPAEEFGGPGRFAFSSEMRGELDLLSDHDAIQEDIVRDWSRYVVGDSDVLVEKSPPNLTKIDWLRSVFDGAKFIIIVRDPRAVSAATQKWSKTSLPELMMHWNAAYSIALPQMCSSDCMVVRYEDICENWDSALDRIGDFTNLRRKDKAPCATERFRDIRNCNEKYIQLHGCRSYGVGVWEQFGYKV